VMFVDQRVGTAITTFMQGRQKERSLTHDLLVYRLAYNGDVVAFKMGRRPGGPSRTGP